MTFIGGAYLVLPDFYSFMLQIGTLYLKRAALDGQKAYTDYPIILLKDIWREANYGLISLISQYLSLLLVSTSG